MPNDAEPQVMVALKFTVTPVTLVEYSRKSKNSSPFPILCFCCCGCYECFLWRRPIDRFRAGVDVFRGISIKGTQKIDLIASYGEALKFSVGCLFCFVGARLQIFNEYFI